MSKLIWLIWLLLLNGLTALALPTGIAEIPICSVHCPQPIVALSFDYDDSSTGIFDYDGATVYTASECASQSATSRALFATFANFLAADAADAALNQTYRLSAGADRSSILQMNRDLYDAFIESGGTFNSMRGVVNISSDTGNQILGAYNSVENSISLYNGSNLSTISEELIHWTQIQRTGLIGQPIPKALVPSLEQSAQTTLLQWGYEPIQ